MMGPVGYLLKPSNLVVDGGVVQTSSGRQKISGQLVKSEPLRTMMMKLSAQESTRTPWQ